MITTLVASLLVAPAPGAWGPSPISAESLVRNVDNRLASLSKATVSYRYSYLKMKVGGGFMDCSGQIVRPGVFSIQVPRVSPTMNQVMNRELWISTGRQFGWAVEPEKPKPGPMSARPAPPAKPADAWFTDFSKIILSGLGRPTRPITGFLQDARRKGYKTVVQKRTLPYKGRSIVSYRLVATKGPARYEVVIDGKGFLPVSVTNTVGRQDNSRWSAVKWNLKPGKSLKPAEIKFRKEGGVINIAPTPRRP